ncbi:hydrogenase maturation protease, partial [Chloroflexota bacterium]
NTGKNKIRTLILGLGNPILTDDGAGIKIARKIKEITAEPEVQETCEAGITLLDYIEGYDKLIIIDSIKTEQGKPGELYKIDINDFKPAMDLSLSHGMDIATAFEIGRGMGRDIPSVISIYGIEIKDNLTFAEECTEEIEKVIPLIAQQIIEEEKL